MLSMYPESRMESQSSILKKPSSDVPRETRDGILREHLTTFPARGISSENNILT